jgi:hypothetical protein
MRDGSGEAETTLAFGALGATAVCESASTATAGRLPPDQPSDAANIIPGRA